MVLATETHLRQYREEGYCLVEELIPDDLIEAARQRTMEIAGDLPDWSARHFQVLDPSRYKAAGAVRCRAAFSSRPARRRCSRRSPTIRAWPRSWRPCWKGQWSALPIK